VSGQLIGVDVGGTKVSVATMRDGELSHPQIQPTEKSSGDALVDQLASAIEAVREPDAAAVGLGVPSAVQFATGRALSGVNVPLEGVPLRAILTQRLGLPVFVDNDANVAALAEAHDDRGRLVAHHLVMFTVGTGVGGGLVLGGRLYRGVTGAGAEMGHIVVGLDMTDDVPQPAPTFPQPGSLEALAAGTELDRLAAASAAAKPDTALGRLAAAGKHVGGPECVAAAKDGDPEAVRLLSLLGRRLGVGIASAINLFDPEQVVIGGGVAVAGDLLLEPARESARGFILPGVGTRTEIRLARYGVEAGVRGAALLAGQEVGAPAEVVT
jgi:glucokinase